MGDGIQMERIRVKWRNLSLRKAFICTVLTMVCLTALLSLATILFCLWGRNYLLPNTNLAYLTMETEYSNGDTDTWMLLIDLDKQDQEFPVKIGNSIESEGKEVHEGITKYGITKAERGYDYLTPKRKLAYQILGAGMVVLPVLYAVFGILFCAMWFYRHKLSVPISRLEYAIGQIRRQDLEFELETPGKDELGRVCASFEEMRKILYQNNQSLWNMLEERKRLQASVAHDLRNPITIIQTYTEYLKLNLANDSLTEEQMETMVNNLQLTAKRLEQYTDSIRDISKLEEMEVCPILVDLTELMPDMEEELGLLAEREDKKLTIKRQADELQGMADVAVLYRILENLVSNAARYAKETIQMELMARQDDIMIRITDDGPGFPQKVLSGRKTYFTTADGEDGHMGMGLAICHILCRKLGGKMDLYNKRDGGAKIIIPAKAKCGWASLLAPSERARKGQIPRQLAAGYLTPAAQTEYL